jgi:hypothetical protein
VDEGQSLLTVNHQTTINSSVNPAAAKQRPESQSEDPAIIGNSQTTSLPVAVPLRLKSQWKWPTASSTIALASQQIHKFSKTSAPVIPPQNDQCPAASNLTQISSRTIGFSPSPVRKLPCHELQNGPLKQSLDERLNLLPSDKATSPETRL